MKILKGLLMIITAPVILVLTLFVWLCTGLIYISAAAGCDLAAGKGAEFEICHSGLGLWIKNTQSHKMPNTVC